MPLDETGKVHAHAETDVEDEETPFPDVVGSTDPLVSVRDAEPYTPATDPPLLPGGKEGVHVATGFGESALEETAREHSPRGDQEVLERALRLLHDDSLTSTLDLHIRIYDGVIHLTGRVPSVDDAEYAQSVLGELAGVVDVVDDTEFDPAVPE